MLFPVLCASAIVVFIMVVLWLVQIKTKKADIVDVAWSYNFTIIAWTYYFLASGWEPRKLLLAIIVSIWSIRLGTYLFGRVMTHKGEEGRYVQLRNEWKGQENWKFFIFFMFQAIINIVLSLPHVLASHNSVQGFRLLEYIGLAIFATGIIGESVADWQLKQFKKNPANKGQVCQSGLWNYSRHPNYFFEFTIWLGFAFFAASAPYGYLAFISPLLILYFLLKVTGIPMTEDLAVKSKGQKYIDYQKTTSKFVPWFKKS